MLPELIPGSVGTDQAFEVSLLDRRQVRFGDMSQKPFFVSFTHPFPSFSSASGRSGADKRHIRHPDAPSFSG
jgi:hypothetical protein